MNTFTQHERRQISEVMALLRAGFSEIDNQQRKKATYRQITINTLRASGMSEAEIKAELRE